MPEGKKEDKRQVFRDVLSSSDVTESQTKTGTGMDRMISTSDLKQLQSKKNGKSK